jgi:hypothetical protein
MKLNTSQELKHELQVAVNYICQYIDKNHLPGIKRTTISSWCRGVTTPSPERFVHFLHVSGFRMSMNREDGLTLHRVGQAKGASTAPPKGRLLQVWEAVLFEAEMHGLNMDTTTNDTTFVAKYKINKKKNAQPRMATIFLLTLYFPKLTIEFDGLRCITVRGWENYTRFIPEKSEDFDGTIEHKWCPGCGEEKPLNEFSAAGSYTSKKTGKTRRYRGPYCIICDRQYHLNYYYNNKEARKDYYKNYKLKVKGSIAESLAKRGIFPDKNGRFRAEQLAEAVFD